MVSLFCTKMLVESFIPKKGAFFLFLDVFSCYRVGGESNKVYTRKQTTTPQHPLLLDSHGMAPD